MKSHLLSISGITVEVREYGSADKPAVLAIHGWANTLERSDAFLKHLTKNFHLFTLILPGYGLSQSTPKAQRLIFTASLIDPLCKKLQIKPALLGYSLGTVILGNYLEEHKNFNDPVVFIGAPMHQSPRPFALHLVAFRPLRQIIRQMPFLQKLLIAQSKQKLKHFNPGKKRKLWITPTHEATTVGLFDSLLSTLSPFPDPRTLTQSIEYIYGQEDFFIPLSEPPEKLTIIPAASHLIVYEQPEILGQTVRQILSKALKQ